MADVANDIVAKAASGDMGAFEEIYKATCDFVYAVAFRITGSHEDAQEAGQEVFLKVYRNLPRFRFQSSFKTWIYRIATTTAIDIYNKKRRAPAVLADCDDAPDPAGPDGRQRHEIDRDGQEALVKSMLSALNPGQRACIALRNIQGLSYKEIAAVLNININTVRSRLKRARLRLVNLRQKGVISCEL